LLPVRYLRCLALSLLLVCGIPLFPQTAQRNGRLVIVMPFENVSKVPGIEWIGDSFPEVLGIRFSAAQFFVIPRQDRLYAFDHLGLPAHVHPSRATLFRIAEEMDVDYVVLGKFQYDGRTFTARAQVMQMDKLRLSPEVVESGSLTQLVDIQNGLAWDLMRSIDARFLKSKNDYVSQSPSVRLDALENLVRGVGATDEAEKAKYLREAVRVSPEYFEAWLQLGRTYFDEKQYDNAITALGKIPAKDAAYNEANFYLGLAAYYAGKYDRAEEAFGQLENRVPLIEVYNNLGVVSARLNKKTAAEYFRRAAEADSRDSDYRFNLAVASYRAGNIQECQRQLKEALSLNPQDAEAKSFLESLSAGSVPKPPLERIKRNYDETSYRQLALEIQQANEARFAMLPPKQHAEAHINHGKDLLAQNMPQQAELDFREALLLSPDNAAAHAGLAQALETQDESAEARNEAMEANRIALSAEAFLVLARMEWKQQRASSAQDYLQRALTLEPNNADALQLQREMNASTRP
jgi:tetratricopeptide (TPR) repeat protein